MAALQKWNGGVIVISHDERFITKVANEVSSVLVSMKGQLTDICEVVGMRRWDSHQVQRRCSKLQGP
jgi:ATPase subunit of ABC transporter with duplicated ATPase domains